MRMRASILCIFVLFLLSVSPLAGKSYGVSQDIDAAVRRAVNALAGEAGRNRSNPWVVAVGTLTYADTGIGSEFSSYLGGRLREALRGSSAFLVSDTENIDKVMEQIKLALTGLTDAQGAPEVGKLRSATALLEGRYEEIGGKIELRLELTEVETGLSVAGCSFTLNRADIPSEVALLPDNYNDAMAVVEELSKVMGDSDEGLETRVWTSRGNGATYRDGEDLIIRFFANRDCFIKVYHIDVKRKTSLIFPNRYYSDNRIRAGKIYSIPDEHYPFRFELGAPFGTEFIKVIASTLQFKEIEEAFSELGSAGSGVLTRGLAVKAKEEMRSEEMISYTIVE